MLRGHGIGDTEMDHAVGGPEDLLTCSRCGSGNAKII
jgi:hypothetical protein